MKVRKLLIATFSLLIISWPSYSLAGSGCCSWHGGQSYCDSSVGRWVCADGTYSPSCGCAYNPPVSKPKIIAAPKTDYQALSKDLQSKLSSCETTSKKDADTCSLHLSKQQEISEGYYAELQEQKDTTSYLFWFALASAILNIWLYKRTSH